MSRTFPLSTQRSEDELVTLTSPDGQSALRIRLVAGFDGYIQLEQLAHSDTLGWYAQKTFRIPGDQLAALLPHLRMANCLMIPRQAPLPDTGVPLPFPGRAEEPPLQQSN